MCCYVKVYKNKTISNNKVSNVNKIDSQFMFIIRINLVDNNYNVLCYNFHYGLWFWLVLDFWLFIWESDSYSE